MASSWSKNESEMDLKWVFFGPYMMGPVLMNTMSMCEYAVGVILSDMNIMAAGYS